MSSVSRSRADVDARASEADSNNPVDGDLEASDDSAQSTRRMRVLVLQVLLIVLIVVLWEFGGFVTIGDRPLVDGFLWSQPSRIVVRIQRWIVDGTVARNLYVTLYEVVSAFTIGVVGGVVVGFLLGVSEFWSRVFRPFLQVANSIPRLILAPLFFIIFGLGESSKIALASVVVFFIAFFNAFQGVREVDRNVYNNALLLGADRWEMARYVLLPSALSWILSSLHIAVGFTMSAVIVAEYLGSSRGMGNLISRSQGTLDSTGVMAGLVILSLFVIVVQSFVGWVEKRLLRWKPESSHSAAT